MITTTYVHHPPPPTLHTNPGSTNHMLMFDTSGQTVTFFMEREALEDLVNRVVTHLAHHTPPEVS